jgi:hypothetical protein
LDHEVLVFYYFHKNGKVSLNKIYRQFVFIYGIKINTYQKQFKVLKIRIKIY